MCKCVKIISALISPLTPECKYLLFGRIFIVKVSCSSDWCSDKRMVWINNNNNKKETHLKKITRIKKKARVQVCLTCNSLKQMYVVSCVQCDCITDKSLLIFKGKEIIKQEIVLLLFTSLCCVYPSVWWPVQPTEVRCRVVTSQQCLTSGGQFKKKKTKKLNGIVNVWILTLLLLARSCPTHPPFFFFFAVNPDGPWWQHSSIHHSHYFTQAC